MSEATRDYLRGLGVPEGRLALIPNAVAPAEPAPEGRAAVLGGWPADAWVVGVVARVEPVKGIDDLLDAVAAVRRDRPRVRCLVVGDGRARPALEAQAARLGLEDGVRFTGFRDDVGALLSGLDAFCLPSHSEGLPFALLEACAHRLPLLVTGVGGMAALLDDGDTAHVVPPRDPAALAERLRAMVDRPDEAAAMAARAHDLVRTRFSLDAMVDGDPGGLPGGDCRRRQGGSLPPTPRRGRHGGAGAALIAMTCGRFVLGRCWPDRLTSRGGGGGRGGSRGRARPCAEVRQGLARDDPQQDDVDDPPDQAAGDDRGPGEVDDLGHAQHGHPRAGRGDRRGPRRPRACRAPARR